MRLSSSIAASASSGLTSRNVSESRASTSLANATDPATPRTPRATRTRARVGWDVPPSSIEITSGMCCSNGQYPIGMIDWGNGSWWLAGPYGKFPTKSLSFNGPTLTSAMFRLVTPRRLLTFDVYNGGSADTSLTVSCPGQPTRHSTIPAGVVNAYFCRRLGVPEFEGALKTRESFHHSAPCSNIRIRGDDEA